MFLYISIVNVKILNISFFYFKDCTVSQYFTVPPATYQLYRWRVENRDIRVNHASTCIVELLRTCLHAFILHRAPTLSTHTQIVSVCVWVRTITLLSTHALYHPMRITSIEIARISMHRSNILDLELR